MDAERFDRARRKMTADRQRAGIGTLGEKTVHAALKEYYGGGEESKEIAVGDFVADAVTEEGIVEIQTRALYRLNKKLETLLPVCRVTVVYPLEAEKYLSTIDPDSGELISKRKSPKKVGLWHGVAELYGIRDKLCDENLTVRFPVLTVEELRLPPKGKGRRRRAEKLDRIPLAMTDEFVLRTAEDLRRLLPEELTKEFTAEDFARLVRTDIDTARRCIGVLNVLGIAEESGKQGRKKLWKIT